MLRRALRLITRVSAGHDCRTVTQLCRGPLDNSCSDVSGRNWSLNGCNDRVGRVLACHAFHIAYDISKKMSLCRYSIYPCDDNTAQMHASAVSVGPFSLTEPNQTHQVAN